MHVVCTGSLSLPTRHDSLCKPESATFFPPAKDTRYLLVREGITPSSPTRELLLPIIPAYPAYFLSFFKPKKSLHHTKVHGLYKDQRLFARGEGVKNTQDSFYNWGLHEIFPTRGLPLMRTCRAYYIKVKWVCLFRNNKYVKFSPPSPQPDIFGDGNFKLLRSQGIGSKESIPPGLL
jgi:hypothetical protein